MVSRGLRVGEIPKQDPDVAAAMVQGAMVQGAMVQGAMVQGMVNQFIDSWILSDRIKRNIASLSVTIADAASSDSDLSLTPIVNI